MMHKSSLALIKQISKINLVLNDELKPITYQQVDGDIFLKKNYEKYQKLRGLVWRDERNQI
jgi:hypothetical protein